MSAEEVAYAAFLTGFVLTGCAAVCYLALPLWPRVAYRSATTDTGATMTVAGENEPPAWLGPLATGLTWAAVAALTFSLGARWVAAERPPYANMWEFTVGFGWAMLLFYALFEWRALRRAAEMERDDQPSPRAVGGFVVAIVLSLFAVSVAFFPADLRPLIPALQASRILGAHVATIMLAYAALSVSFGAAAMYLLQGGGQRFGRLPTGDLLEEIANRAVLVGFPLLTLGISLGAYWAYSAWGRYWGWDAKETSALFTWLVYAGYLHARNLRGWKGTGSAWVLVVGFAAVLFTYFAVNLWVSSIHSYAGV
jgi:cytochrome c-type biogenesis protein CcsB